VSRDKIPPSWRATTLGEISREKPNNGIFRKNPEYLPRGSEGLPVVWLEELFRGNLIDTKDSRRICETASEVKRFGLKKGDMLFCRSSLKLDGIAFNNVYLGEDNAALFECHLIRISPNLEMVSPVFLNWLLRSPQLRAVAKSKSKTATMTTIDQQSLASIPIMLPPLAEQRRIAEVLDRAEALRAKRRAALAQLDTLTQAIFLDLFGDPVLNSRAWPSNKLGEVGTLDRGVSKHRPRNAPELLGGSYPLVQTGEVANCNGYIRRHNATYSEVGLRQSKMWPAGTLCITIAANIAKTGILTFDACFPDSIVGFRADEPSTVEFVRCWLSFHQERLEDAAPESAQKNINLAILRGLDVPLPPLTRRREFARRVAAVEELKTAHHASLVEMDALFASLQHRAFRGEL